MSPTSKGHSYRTIIVHLDAGTRRRARLDLAFTLAERHDAHLIGLFALESINPPTPEVAAMWIEEMLKQRRAAAAEVEQEFRDKMRMEQYTGRSEWRSTLDNGLAALQLHARFADLLVAGQPDPAGDGVPAWFSRELVMSIGGPVLYVPHAGRFDDCGTNVLVPWNASRESARAVQDALPLLQQSAHTEVVTFGKGKARLDDYLPDPDIAAYLARHGAGVLSRAADNAADLVVMGAYSHSRLRELVLGGATRTMFDSMTVPTLMSH
jgi:nucleotide-binding universal stress UspA family protein